MYFLGSDSNSASNYLTAGDRAFDICLRLQSFHREEPSNYELFKDLIGFGHQLTQKGDISTSTVDSALKEIMSVDRSLKFLIDHYGLLFVDGDLLNRQDIIEQCRYNAYADNYDDQTGYDEYVVRNFNSGELPEYEGSYSEFLSHPYKRPNRY